MFVVGVVVGRGWRRSLLETVTVAVAAVVVLVPWTIRNAAELHGFVPVSTGIGETLCVGHQPAATGGYVFDTEYCVGPYDSAHITEPHLEVERNRYTTRQAVKYAFGHPVDEVRLFFRRGWYLLHQDHDGIDATNVGAVDQGFVPSRARDALALLADLYYFAVVVLAAMSVTRFAGRSPARGGRFLLLLTAAGLLAIPLELYGLPRYKVPLAPFLALGAAATLVRFLPPRVSARPRAAVAAP